MRRALDSSDAERGWNYQPRHPHDDVTQGEPWRPHNSQRCDAREPWRPHDVVTQGGDHSEMNPNFTPESSCDSDESLWGSLSKFRKESKTTPESSCDSDEYLWLYDDVTDDWWCMFASRGENSETN